MIRKLLSGAVALAFLTGTAMAVHAAMKCEVKKIAGDEVTIKCKAKDIKKLKVGKKVKVKKK